MVQWEPRRLHLLRKKGHIMQDLDQLLNFVVTLVLPAFALVGFVTLIVITYEAYNEGK